MRSFATFLLLLFLNIGCSNDHGLVVVSKEIRRESLGQAVANDQFGSAASTVIENVVVGRVQNTTEEDIPGVELTFHITGGGQNYALVAYLPSVPAGKTVPFETRRVRTQYTLAFKDDGEAEIAIGKKPE
jgi:hypothetical protein